MIRVENTGDELYVYCNEKLIYKKWLNTGVDRIMHECEGLSQFYRWPWGFVANKTRGQVIDRDTYKIPPKGRI